MAAENNILRMPSRRKLRYLAPQNEGVLEKKFCEVEIEL